MAIACLRLFTLPPFPPGPDFRVPRFLRRIALATVFPADFEYFRPDDLRPDDVFVCAMSSSWDLENLVAFEVVALQRRPGGQNQSGSPESAESRQIMGIQPTLCRSLLLIEPNQNLGVALGALVEFVVGFRRFVDSDVMADDPARLRPSIRDQVTEILGIFLPAPGRFPW